MKPQDVVILLKLGSAPEAPTAPLTKLSSELGISASEIHGALNRSAAAGLLDSDQRRPRPRPLLEFLEHGIRYVFVPTRSGITRGVPTAHSASPLSDALSGSVYKRVAGPRAALNQAATFEAALATPGDPSGPLARMFSESNVAPSETGPLAQMFGNHPIVWPHPEGDLRGEGLEPLYPSSVEAARRDRKLHECLALVDALRIGSTRERRLAIDLLSERLRPR